MANSELKGILQGIISYYPSQIKAGHKPETSTEREQVFYNNL